jgi:hypothetical protein
VTRTPERGEPKRSGAGSLPLDRTDFDGSGFFADGTDFDGVGFFADDFAAVAADDFVAGALLVVPELLVAAVGGVAFLAAGLIGEVWQSRFGPGGVSVSVERLWSNAVRPRLFAVWLGRSIRSGGDRGARVQARWRRGAGCSCPDRR